MNYLDPDGEWARKVGKFNQQYVKNDLLEIRINLMGSDYQGLPKLIQMIKVKNMHGGDKQFDYKQKYGTERWAKPPEGTGECYSVKEYFDVPDRGVMDPAEYGNYLAGYSAGIYRL